MKATDMFNAINKLNIFLIVLLGWNYKFCGKEFAINDMFMDIAELVYWRLTYLIEFIALNIIGRQISNIILWVKRMQTAWEMFAYMCIGSVERKFWINTVKTVLNQNLMWINERTQTCFIIDNATVIFDRMNTLLTETADMSFKYSYAQWRFNKLLSHLASLNYS